MIVFWFCVSNTQNTILQVFQLLSNFLLIFINMYNYSIFCCKLIKYLSDSGVIIKFYDIARIYDFISLIKSLLKIDRNYFNIQISRFLLSCSLQVLQLFFQFLKLMLKLASSRLEPDYTPLDKCTSAAWYNVLLVTEILDYVCTVLPTYKSMILTIAVLIEFIWTVLDDLLMWCDVIILF